MYIKLWDIAEACSCTCILLTNSLGNYLFSPNGMAEYARIFLGTDST